MNQQVSQPDYWANNTVEKDFRVFVTSAFDHLLIVGRLRTKLCRHWSSSR